MAASSPPLNLRKGTDQGPGCGDGVKIWLFSRFSFLLIIKVSQWPPAATVSSSVDILLGLGFFVIKVAGCGDGSKLLLRLGYKG